MMKILSVTVCISALLLFPVSAHSDVMDDILEFFFGNEATSLPSVSNIQIFNNSHDTLYFYYKSTGKQWTKVEIEGGGDEGIPCGESEILLETNGGQVHYVLECNNRYQLYWDTRKRLWDVARLTN